MNKLELRSLFERIYKVTKYILAFSCNIIGRITESIMEKMRFSISFKITITYVFIFSIVFLLMAAGVMGSFVYYTRSGGNWDYNLLLSVVMVVLGISGLVLVVVFGSKASRKFLSPVHQMTETVKEISIKDLGRRIDVRGSKNELKDLAKTFNEMLDRIQNSVEQQNQFISDASHELRTPISVIQGYADLLDRWGKNDRAVLEESIESIKSEAENMKELVEKLLFLARGDRNAQKLERSKFSLNELIGELIKETRIIDKEHILKNEHNDKIDIWADRKLMKEALRIFIDNSIKYTPSGGAIMLDSYLRKGEAVIVVSDTGAGIAEKDIPHIFDRFYRADKSRTKSSGGTGLGLSIAKWIIDQHNGKISVWSEIQIGTVIKIILPVFEV
ncbi:sensor histidine kinase [Clostridium luticellarii]|jgi:signal transduction histidine kinase|uniref:sensor histidine kinase n=1 Tax=Clostridium luticellarii TaxID=1691940 RepID=UPI0023539257|nr:ATP-binding protein [Clostridium luticellarii]MCI1944124.1 ATP-binding protein [Clostridium luticellarii]MCI1967234.1 ATP-binding protein [Clostridium luticellarii]